MTVQEALVVLRTSYDLIQSDPALKRDVRKWAHDFVYGELQSKVLEGTSD